MTIKSQKETLLVAFGGNALLRKNQQGAVEEQFDNLRVPIRQIARLSSPYRTLITHGNAPQVGKLLLQQECCSEVPPLPLEILVAQTQGQLGYMIESTLESELMNMGIVAEQFVRKQGKRAVITSIEKIEDAVQGKAGTEIIP